LCDGGNFLYDGFGLMLFLAATQHSEYGKSIQEINTFEIMNHHRTAQV
jgi:hypothetical protein